MVTTITCNKLQDLLKQGDPVRIIDVRDEEKWKRGHIHGSELLPLALLEVLAAERLPDKAEHIVLYCTSGGRAMMAAKVLQGMGYTNVAVLEGGYCRWSDIVR